MLDQTGMVGDITATRKVKVPDCSDEQLSQHLREQTPFPWHWSNSLYLEWFSLRHGRVMIESSDFILDLDPAAAWTMSPAEETEQRIANGKALTDFMQRVVDAAGLEQNDDFHDAPQSHAEAEAYEESLATPEWSATTRREVAEILGEVQSLIREVREVLG
jgi:hypothetical protein